MARRFIDVCLHEGHAVLRIQTEHISYPLLRQDQGKHAIGVVIGGRAESGDATVGSSADHGQSAVLIYAHDVEVRGGDGLGVGVEMLVHQSRRGPRIGENVRLVAIDTAPGGAKQVAWNGKKLEVVFI